MGKRSEFPRRKNDAYLTWDKRAVPPLLPHLAGFKRFVEPCAGAGHLVDQLELAGLQCVQAYDVAPGRTDIEVGDVLTAHLPPHADFFITNPPWSRPLLHGIIEQLAPRAQAWLLFDWDWCATKQARPYLQRYCHAVVPIGRLRWIEGSDHDAKDACAWYLFGPGAAGAPRIFTPIDGGVTGA